MPLPTFKYHPDPVSTGNVIKSDAECACCAKSRGFIYVGPVYTEADYDGCICPWCIADGTAHDKFDASFTDDAGVGGHGSPAVAESVISEVVFRTPGFSAWQQEQWWTHCKDAGQFLGRVGHRELKALGAGAIAAIRESAELTDDRAWKDYFESLEKDGSPTAYVFKCLHCGAFGGYVDCD